MKNPNVLAAKPPNMKKNTKPQQAKRANNAKSFEMTANPSIVLNPMAAALYSQLSHPHIPQPVPVPVPVAATPLSCPMEALQWVPGDHPSAFVPTKTLRQQKQQQQQTVAAEGAIPSDASAQEQPQQRVVSPSTEEPCAVPERIEFPIHLPELRISEDGEKPKLATLEPELFPLPKNTQASPKKETPPPNSKWQLPEWFEDEHKQIMLKCETPDSSITEFDAMSVPHTEDSITDIQVPTSTASTLSSSSSRSTSPSSFSTDNL